MPDQSTTVSRAAVEQIAANFRELEALRKQQALTQAKMIRACLAAFNQTTQQAERRLMKENPARMPTQLEAQRKVREDKALAFLHLEALATMLENAGGLDLKPQPLSL